VKKTSNIFLALLITFLTALSYGKSYGFTIVEPPDISLVEQEMITIVIIKSDEGSVDSFLISNSKNTSDNQNIPVVKGRNFICKIIDLKLGTNEIVVTSIKGGKSIESKKITIYNRSDLSKEFRVNPPEFKRNPFHLESRESVCRPCHPMDLSEKDIKPLKPQDSVCYPCHYKITEYKHVHGPAARWVCLACHEKTSSPAKYATQKPDKTICYTCHENEKNKWAPKKFVHGPVATGRCSICHNAHASNNDFWLKKSTWNLCVTCHTEMATGKHTVAPFALFGKHPTKGVKDPLRPGKRLTCASCHNPHTANTKDLQVLRQMS
jgi:predicted CXXCH cytochrome family protein